MSQDSDTENNSKQRPKLSLRKKTSPEGEPGTQADANPSKGAETPKRRPLRINKKQETTASTPVEPTADTSPSSTPSISQPPPAQPSTTAQPEQPSPSAPTSGTPSSSAAAPRKKLGLRKRTSEPSADSSATQKPKTSTPPPNITTPAVPDPSAHNAPPPIPQAPPGVTIQTPNDGTPPVPATDPTPAIPPEPIANEAPPVPKTSTPPPQIPSTSKRPVGTPPPVPIEASTAEATSPPPVPSTSAATQPPPAIPTKDLMTEDLEKMESSEKESGSLAKAIGGFSIIAIFFAGAMALLYFGIKSFNSSREPTENELTESEIQTAPAAAKSTEIPAPAEPTHTQEPAIQNQTPEVVEDPILDLPPLIEEPEPVVASKPVPKPKPKPKNVKPNIEVARWVDTMHTSGVSKRKIFIDGTMFTLGSVVNDFPKITWVDVDTQLGVLIFEDENGVRYEKDY